MSFVTPIQSAVVHIILTVYTACALVVTITMTGPPCALLSVHPMRAVTMMAHASENVCLATLMCPLDVKQNVMVIV